MVPTVRIKPSLSPACAEPDDNSAHDLRRSCQAGFFTIGSVPYRSPSISSDTMRSAWPGPPLWEDMHRFATAIRRSSASTSGRTWPVTAAALKSIRNAGRSRRSKCAGRPSKAGSPECSAVARPRLVATNVAYRCIQFARASKGSCSVARIGAASAHASISCRKTAAIRSERCGKCRYRVPTPTPACSATSRTGASTPEAANTIFAEFSKAPRLRCTSVRTRRSAPSRRFGSLFLLSSLWLAMTLFAIRSDVPYKYGIPFRFVSLT